LVAGIIGAVAGTWLWRQMLAQRYSNRGQPQLPFRERGTVIFANTPIASETEFSL
jgi:hypothetical protein